MKHTHDAPGVSTTHKGRQTYKYTLSRWGRFYMGSVWRVWNQDAESKTGGKNVGGNGGNIHTYITYIHSYVHTYVHT